MTSMADVPLHEKIEWLMGWDAECTVRIHYSPFDQSYEILFKHKGCDKWHEHHITEYQLRGNTMHEALRPLRTHLMMTKP